MTDEQWAEILRAYADWVADHSKPPVQYLEAPFTRLNWVDWTDENRIHRHYPLSKRWRVKPGTRKVRLWAYQLGELVCARPIFWEPGATCPELTLPGSPGVWLGSWQEIPEAID
jgi:hypothetical protein